MTDPVIIKARELAVENMRPGVVVERAILNGSYDKGTLITRWLPEAERIVLGKHKKST